MNVAVKLSRMLCLLVCCCGPWLSGCTTLRQAVGLRVKLAKLPLTAMAASLPQLPGKL